MSTTSDPILLLRDLRGEPRPPGSDTQRSARDAMFTKHRTTHRRSLIAAIACLLLAAGVVVMLAPWAHTQSAAAAVDELASTAAAQPTVKIGPRDWIVTNYTTVRSWTTDYTQEKLDLFSSNAVATSEAANGSGHFLRAGGGSISRAKQRAADRMNQRRIARVRAGVKIEQLPVTHVTARNESTYTSARDARGFGGGGGGNNTILYDTPEQKAAGKVLQRAGIGGLHADPVDMGGFEIADLPTRAVGDESEVERLSSDPSALRTQLADWKALPELDVSAGAPQDLFVKGAGVVLSPYATPARRAATIRMIAALPGVSIDQSASDPKGRAGVGMTLPMRGGTMQLVFDTDDSRLFGVQMKIDDPVEFVGEQYAGAGRDRVDVLPRFDSATIGVSYAPVEVKRDGPPCTPTFCTTGPHPSRSLLKRMREAAGTG